MNTNNTHPIEFVLAIALTSIESLLWIINEFAGFHKHPATFTETNDIIDMTWEEFSTPTVSTKPSESLARPFIQPLFTELASLTKRQLQTLTGIRSSRYNKLQLLSIAAAYA